MPSPSRTWASTHHIVTTSYSSSWSCSDRSPRSRSTPLSSRATAIAPARMSLPPTVKPYSSRATARNSPPPAPTSYSFGFSTSLTSSASQASFSRQTAGPTPSRLASTQSLTYSTDTSSVSTTSDGAIVSSTRNCARQDEQRATTEAVRREAGPTWTAVEPQAGQLIDGPPRQPGPC